MLEKLSEYLAKLKKEAKTNDLAKRIYESIDPNIVDILLRLTSSSDNIEVKPIYLESSLHQMIRNEKPELRNWATSSQQYNWYHFHFINF